MSAVISLLRKVPGLLPLWQQCMKSPWFRQRVDDALLFKMYGTTRPESLLVPGTPHVMYVNPRENRGRAILKCRAAGQPLIKTVWRNANRLLQPNAAIDVGLNYGEIALCAEYAPTTRIVGIEANPELEPFLRRSLAAHPNARQFELFIALASDRAQADASFFIDRAWSGRSSVLLDGKQPGIEECRVPSVCLDELFADGDLRDDALLFKIDVEGFEPIVLRGMKRLLSECPRWVGIIEFNSDLLERLNVKAEEFLEQLLAQAKIVSLDKHGRSTPITSPHLEQFGDSQAAGGVCSDLLLISHGCSLTAAQLTAPEPRSPTA